MTSKSRLVSYHKTVGEFQLHVVMVVVWPGLSMASSRQVLRKNTQMYSGIDCASNVLLLCVVLDQHGVLTVLLVVDAVSIEWEEELLVQGSFVIPDDEMKKEQL